MELSMSGGSLRTFGRCVTFLARVASELVLQAHPAKLEMHTLNSSRSAYASVSLARDFFDQYTLDAAASAPSSTPLQCSVLLKSLLAVLRTPHAALDRLAVSLPEPDAPKLQITLHCLNDRRASVDNRFGALGSRGKRPFCPPPIPFASGRGPGPVQAVHSLAPSSSRTAAAIETACVCSPLPHCLFSGGGDFPPSPLRRPPSPAMAHRNVASASRSMASRSIEDDFGKETGLPLIVCPLCNRERTIELIVKSTEKGNQGRVFFKCPRNVQGMPGRCTFYEFQKTYLKKLVELKYVSIDLEAGLGEAAANWLGEGEAESQPVISKAWKGIENKLDDLISMFKMLIAVLCFSSVVGLIYVLK